MSSATAASREVAEDKGGASTQARTLPQLCISAALRYGKPDALNHKSQGRWVHLSAEEFVGRVRAVTLGLAELGIKRGDRVALLSENRPEWSIADLAILTLGAVNVPIYTTQAVEQVRFILEDSGSRALFVSGRKVFKHAREGVEGIKGLEHLIFFDSEAAENVERSITLEELEARGAKVDEDDRQAFERLVEQGSAEDLATIIYTSGTTGEPKGVMLSHSNFISNVLSISNTLPISNSDTALSVLPLSHIFERAAFYIFCWCGVSVYYAASFDQVGDHLREVRPTVMTAVPRLFEKVYQRIIKKGMAEKGWKRWLFVRALEVGQRYAELKDKGEAIPPSMLAQQRIASRLVFSKWRAGVGGRLRYFVSGGAPLSPTLSYSFIAAGIPILQGYGATETCIVSANRPDENKIGSVGIPFPGIEVKIAEDGEILIRGENVMQGYYKKPEETARVIRDGWFSTGDVGHIDESGHLYITDRKKDLFKLSNGKYVAPQMVESLIKQSGLVSQVVVLGMGRKQPAALIVPDWEALNAAIDEQGEQVEDRSRAVLSRNPVAVKIVQREVASLTSSLADYERVRRVALVPDEFTIDGGELTPTLKVKRDVVSQKYAEVLDSLY